MLNLSTTYPLTTDRPLKAHELPVLVDLNWFGQVMTSPNAGIVRFPSLQSSGSDDSLCI